MSPRQHDLLREVSNINSKAAWDPSSLGKSLLLKHTTSFKSDSQSQYNTRFRTPRC